MSGDSKELFVQRFVKVFDQKRNQRTGTPAVFTLPWYTVRSSHQSRCIRKLFLKSVEYPQEAPVLDSILKKVADL